MNDASRLHDSLFQPSLSSRAPAVPLYSLRAGFLVSFFGGVYGASVFALINARRMARCGASVWPDVTLAALAAAAWTAVLLWAGALIVAGHASGDGPGLPGWMEMLGTGGSGLRRLGNAAGLGLFGLHFLLRRTRYRAHALAGQESPNPWVMGLGTVVGAFVLSVAVAGVGGLVAGAP